MEVREREILDAEGRPHVIESSVSPILDTNGCMRGAVEIIEDMTEIKQLRERLHRLDKLAALGEMAASLAHEIRNPLNGIEGFASLLERDLDPDDKRRTFARYIVEGVRALNQTVTDMLAYTRPQKLNVREVRVSDVIDSVAMLVEEDVRKRGIEGIDIQADLDPQADVIQADPDQLRQSLLNVMLNAVQVMPNGGKLRVFTRANGHRVVSATGNPEYLERDTVQIGVADTGPGMDDEVKANIFNPFFTTRSEGNGLGLAIVHKIIDLHGGEIVVDSAPNEGTTFYINLPKRQAVPALTG